MRYQKTGILLVFILTLWITPMLFSCQKETGETETLPLDQVKFSVPSTATVQAGEQTMTFRILFGNAPLASDLIVLATSDGEQHDCPIIYMDETSFTFSLFEGIRTDTYSVSLKRGTQVRYMGDIRITISDGVVAKEGVTVYGKVSCNGNPLQGVVVSDGVEVVATDEEGVYQMNSAKKYGYVFVSVPGGYETSIDGVLPVNYLKLIKDPKEAERVDFNLFEAGDQTNHTMLVFGDMHLANRNNDRDRFSEFCKEINAYLDAHGSEKVYALTLGDMTWDYYWYSNAYQFDAYLSDVNEIKGLTIYHTIGNHDHDMNSAGDFDTVLQYMNTIAPDYYSFNIGNVHYIVLDDILCTNNGGGRDFRTYNQTVTDEQLEWLRKDLSFVPESTPVVVAMHAPTVNINSLDRARLTSLFAGYSQVHFVTGHTHKVANYNVDNYIDHNCGAVCADWWWSAYNTSASVHIAQDGAPGGYEIFWINGDEFKWQFKPTCMSSDLQFRTYDRNQIVLSSEKMMPSVSQTYKDAFDALSGIWALANYSNEVYINVWNYGEGWKIEVTEDGNPLTVSQVSGIKDPLHVLTYSAVAMKTSTSPTFKTTNCYHLWKVVASSASSTLEVKVTDCFGNVYTETMTRPKAFDVATYSR
ncbi:MAG: calcineurin-like phosphoesterase C-terminal domain-containing protein [Candidatus Cryptobacteroides sp.]